MGLNRNGERSHMGDCKRNIIMYQHPDELFDRPYREITLLTDTFHSIEGRCKVENDTCSLRMQFADGNTLEISSYRKGILRIQAYPKEGRIDNYIELEPLDDESYTTIEDEKSVAFVTEHFIVQLDKETKDFIVKNKKEEILLKSVHGGIQFSEEEAEYSGCKTMATFEIVEGEHFYGFGGRTAKPDRLGSTADMFNVKAGVVSGDYGGCCVPFFISTKGYGFLLNNPWPHVYFDMGKTKKDEWFYHAPGGNCDIFLIQGDNMKDIAVMYTELTGKMPIPPKWMFGFWASSLTIKNADELLETAKQFRKEEFPCDVLLIDAQWRVGPEFLEQYTTGAEYKSNDLNWSKHFGDQHKLLEELKKMNFKLGLHMNSRNFSEETEKVGIEKKYLRRHNQEVVPNFLDQDANAYYQKLVEERVKEGIDVWWIDHSDRVSGEIAKGVPSRNLLGNYWCKSVAEVMERNKKETTLSFTRGGGIGGQRYGFPWPGDTSNGIEHFEEDLWFCMNAGIAGYPITSVDIGGFNLRHLVYGLKHSEHYQTDEDINNEVFGDSNIIRRVCQSLICIPVPRIHNNWCTPPKLPWNCKARQKQIYRKFLEERYRLILYYYSTAIHSARTGEPMLKPLVYEYDKDEMVYGIQDECLLGQSLLLAPITKDNVVKRKVYLPEGIWFSMWNDTRYVGPATIEVEAPLEEIEGLPIFVKQDSVIPRQDVKSHIEEEPAKHLYLDFYLEARAELLLHETATITNVMIAEKMDSYVRITVTNKTEEERTYTLQIHGCKVGEILEYKNCKRLSREDNELIVIQVKNGKNAELYVELVEDYQKKIG